MTVTHLTDTAACGCTEPRTLRITVVGTGFMGRVHAAAARRAGAEVVAAVAGTADGAADAAGGVGAERGYADLHALPAEAGADVVHVCTPNARHAEAVDVAPAAGAHVICEKPPATGVADATAPTGAAEAASRVATVPFVCRFHPMVRELDWADVVAALAEARYTGPLCVESFTGENASIATAAPTQDALATDDLRFLKEVIGTR
ncbi:Gfo/Idh/MocA family oxidoreductase [Saccharothrix sp. S26]|uniref:Gfo/Idh/MocA family protein n=1 Tax=Saccharothrix sp. S26 TaxID=2907215 RepID=UPI001F29A379|nr:Gfo/Idh/MocA family oxidoreductase [Saccharothrix sp. S26]MCE6998551.1 Gfo/Idh/MocA family oxidoreductase [Saccharothrix sp. S26]